MKKTIDTHIQWEYMTVFIRNNRIFEVAKELVKNGCLVSTAVSIARQLVDEVGGETE